MHGDPKSPPLGGLGDRPCAHLPRRADFLIISHTFPSPPSPFPPPFSSPSQLQLSFLSVSLFPHKGSSPPCAHARQAQQQSKYRTYCGRAVVHAHSACCCDLALSCAPFACTLSLSLPPPFPALYLYTQRRPLTLHVASLSWAAFPPRASPSPLGLCLLPSVAHPRQDSRGYSLLSYKAVSSKKKSKYPRIKKHQKCLKPHYY